VKIILPALFVVLGSVLLIAQTPDAPPPSQAGDAAVPSTPPILKELDRLQTFAERANQDIGHLRIEIWKANSAAKSAAQADATSIQRNITSALPGMIAAVRAEPDNVKAQFELYRNVNALHDVFGTVTDAARIFAQKGEYDALSQELQLLTSVRRNLGETLEQSTAATQVQLKQMRARIAQQREQLAAADAATDDAKKQLALAQAELAKKPTPKKKPAAKKPAATATGSTANPPSPSSSNQPSTGTSTPKPQQ
jgi:hypothetical protein